MIGQKIKNTKINNCSELIEQYTKNVAQSKVKRYREENVDIVLESKRQINRERHYRTLAKENEI